MYSQLLYFRNKFDKSTRHVPDVTYCVRPQTTHFGMVLWKTRSPPTASVQRTCHPRTTSVYLLPWFCLQPPQLDKTSSSDDRNRRTCHPYRNRSTISYHSLDGIFRSPHSSNLQAHCKGSHFKADKTKKTTRSHSIDWIPKKTTCRSYHPFSAVSNLLFWLCFTNCFGGNVRHLQKWLPARSIRLWLWLSYQLTGKCAFNSKT